MIINVRLIDKIELSKQTADFTRRITEKQMNMDKQTELGRKSTAQATC